MYNVCRVRVFWNLDFLELGLVEVILATAWGSEPATTAIT